MRFMTEIEAVFFEIKEVFVSFWTFSYLAWNHLAFLLDRQFLENLLFGQAKYFYENIFNILL